MKNIREWSIPTYIGLAFIILAPFLAIWTWFGAALAAVTGWFFLGGAAQLKKELEEKGNEIDIK